MIRQPETLNECCSMFVECVDCQLLVSDNMIIIMLIIIANNSSDTVDAVLCRLKVGLLCATNTDKMKKRGGMQNVNKSLEKKSPPRKCIKGIRLRILLAKGLFGAQVVSPELLLLCSGVLT